MKRSFLLFGIFLSSSAICQTPCNSTSDLADNFIAKIVATRSPSSDGYVHITYDFSRPDPNNSSVLDRNTTPDPALLSDAQLAVSEWNVYKDTTGIVFDRITQGSTDLSLVADDTRASTCVSAEADQGVVNYSDTFQQLADGAGNNALSTWVFGHELGHLMGVDEDTDDNSFMGQASGTCSNQTKQGLLTPQPADAMAAASCIREAVSLVLSNNATPPPPYYYYYDDGGGGGGDGDCASYYIVANYYIVDSDGNWSFEGSEIVSTFVLCSK